MDDIQPIPLRGLRSFSVDRLKPVISSGLVTPAVPPLRGQPRLVPASVPRPPDPGRPLVKKVRFLLRSSAGILTGRFKYLRLSPLSSSLTF